MHARLRRAGMTGTRERILVVENDPHISDLIARRTLRPLGYVVTVVIDAAGAIEEALKNPFDLIMADLSLPDLEGADVLAALATQGINSPVVVIVAKGEERRAIQAFRLGAADALLWPAREAEIVRVLERAIQPGRSQRIRRELYQQLEGARVEVRRRQELLEEIHAMGRAVTSGSDDANIFGWMLERAAHAAGAEIAWLTARDELTGHQRLRAHYNLPTNWARKTGKPLEDGLSALVLRSGQTLLIHGAPMDAFGISSLGMSAAVIPAKTHKEITAVLVVVRRQDTEIPKSAQPLLEIFADLAALAIVRMRLQETNAAAAKAERQGNEVRTSLISALKAPLGRLQSLRARELGGLTSEQEAVMAEIESSVKRCTELLAGEARPEGG